MSPKQTQLYWRDWSACRKALVASGLPPQEADAMRTHLTTQALGKSVSSKALTNRQLDRVLAAFRAISRPTDDAAQLHAADQDLIRTRAKLQALTDDAGLTPAYVEGMAARIAKHPLADCTAHELRKILAAVNYHLERHPVAPQAPPDPAPQQDQDDFPW